MKHTPHTYMQNAWSFWKVNNSREIREGNWKKSKNLKKVKSSSEVNFLYFYFYFAFFYFTAVTSKVDKIHNWVAGSLQEKPVFLNHGQGEKGPMSQTVKRESILLLLFFLWGLLQSQTCTAIAMVWVQAL